MSADLTASAYLVDGADLAAAGVTLTHDGSGMWEGLSEEIAAETPPGLDGGAIVGGTFVPFTLTIGYTVKGASVNDAWAKIRSLRRRCKPGRTVTLTRQMPDPEGSDTNTALTATARRVGKPRVTWIAPRAAVVDIDWWFAGVWFGAAVAILSASGAVTVAGDVRTRRMTVTLAAGAARTVTNSTNGYWFTFSATVPAGGVLVDVEACTATAITGGADLSASLSWGKKVPMQLESGSNTLAVSAGTASISYQPAYE